MEVTNEMIEALRSALDGIAQISTVEAESAIAAALSTVPSAGVVAVAWGVFRSGEMIAWVPGPDEKAEYKLPEDTDERRPLYTHPPAPEAQVRVKVKPLEWQKRFASEYLSRAETIIGVYRVWSHHEAKGEWYWSIDGLLEHIASDEEAAKAAAQLDFERHILSCLSTPEQGETEAVEGWIKVPDEMPQSLLRSINYDNQVLAYEKGRYFNAWFAFEPSEGGWYWTDDEDSDPNPSHYRHLSEVAIVSEATPPSPPPSTEEDNS